MGALGVNWVNLRVSTLRHPDYIGCEPVARAAWLNVLTFCTEQENGGRIEGARAWKDRQWQQTCGVMLSEVDAAAPLLTWDGDALVVWQYPIDKQKEVSEKREVAKANGKLGGRPKNQRETNEKPTSVKENNQRRPQRPKAEGEGERKENRKEKENGSSAPNPPMDSPTTHHSAHAEFIHFWTEGYPEHHGGEKYAFQAGKDGSAVKALLLSSKLTPAELFEFAVSAWKNPTGFHCKSGAALSTFNSQFNQIREEIRTNGKRPIANSSGTPNRNANLNAHADYSNIPKRTSEAPHWSEGGAG